MSIFQSARNVVATNNTFQLVGRDQINLDQSIHTHHHCHSVASLQERDKLNHPSASSKVFYKPNPSALFQGRQAELDRLKVHFLPRLAGEPRSRRALLLYGMGGIGKTQICLKFVEETSDHFAFTFWIDASTPETTSLSLKGIPEAKLAASDESVDSVLLWISHLKEEWLLVFDNAYEHIHRFIPLGNIGNILITSRNPSVGRSTAFNRVEVSQMDEQDAISLLLKASCLDQAPISEDLQKVAKAIVAELCCLPLAIDQAGASIESGLCPIYAYQQLYLKHRKQLLADSSFRKATSYEQTVYGTWELSYEEIKARCLAKEPSVAQSAKIAIQILEIFACLHHGSIDKEIFRHATVNIEKEKEQHGQLPGMEHELLWWDENGEWDEFQFQTGIRVLLSFSLIKQNLSGTVYSVHPLVHSWSQDKMSQSVLQHKCRLTKDLLSSSIVDSISSEDYIFHQHLIPHIRACQYLAGQSVFEEICDDGDYMKFGLVFGENGDWKKAEELYNQAMNIRKRILGEDHPDTLISMNDLALTYSDLGKWKEAEKLQTQVFNIYKRIFGEEHSYTLTSMNNLALAYSHWGRWKEAEDLQAQILDVNTRVLGKEHPDTLIDMHNLSITFTYQERWKEAEKLQLQVLEAYRRMFGKEHPETLTSIHNLAFVYRNQGRWKEAEELQIQVLDIRKRILGEEHPHTLISMGNLASTYRNQERWKDAEELQIQVLSSQKMVLGEEHPDTLTSMYYLALVYEGQKRWQEAKALMAETLPMCKMAFGDEHPRIQEWLANFASLEKEIRDHSKQDSTQDKAPKEKKHSLFPRLFHFAASRSGSSRKK